MKEERKEKDQEEVEGKEGGENGENGAIFQLEKTKKLVEYELRRKER